MIAYNLSLWPSLRRRTYAEESHYDIRPTSGLGVGARDLGRLGMKQSQRSAESCETKLRLATQLGFFSAASGTSESPASKGFLLCSGFSVHGLVASAAALPTSKALSRRRRHATCNYRPEGMWQVSVLFDSSGCECPLLKIVTFSLNLFPGCRLRQTCRVVWILRPSYAACFLRPLAQGPPHGAIFLGLPGVILPWSEGDPLV